MSMSSESDEKMMATNDKDSPASDDANSGINAEENDKLKKGPWTSAEDAILVDYVTKHGDGNWNAVQRHTGLARCGKSCRLRWANHLRPDLKKGPFSREEENLIIELHAKMGNKWAQMAAELPGRTDNEIKNFWNTRIKRRQRDGLPIYPPEICQKALNESQQKDDINTLSSGDVHYPDFIPVNNFEVPAVEFKTLEFNQQVYESPLLDIPRSCMFNIPARNLLTQGLHSSYQKKPLLSTLHPSEHLGGSESFYPSLSRYENECSVQNAQSFIYPSVYDQTLTSNQVSSSNVLAASNAILNGNASSSEPDWAMKLELPSLQSQVVNWGSPSAPLPSLESVDTLIQTLPTEPTHSCHHSTQNSGLLDAVLHESQMMKKSRNNTPCVMNTSSQFIHETGWEPYGELTSPLHHSSSLSEGTPISGNSFDEPESLEAIPGFRVKESTIWAPVQYEDKDEIRSQKFTRPDFLLASAYSTNDDTENNSMPNMP